MSRYVTRPQGRKPRADWIDEDYPLLPSLVVSDHEAVDTGLVDEHGNTIMRLPDEIGFHHPLA